MNITIINDCKDENAKGRQLARISSLFGCTPNFIGVNNELEAAGNIIDILDANGAERGIILVNIAPRHGKAKKHYNGTPFGYFWYKKTLIISSIDGLTLSLVKKLKVTRYMYVLNIPETLDILIKDKIIPARLKNNIVNSQFRSYDFLPRIAFYIFKNKNIKSNKTHIKTVLNAPAAVWWVDNFGNCKTTLLLKELANKNTAKTLGKVKNIKYFERLKDVPNGKPGFIVGSSGLENKRFLEIVVQGDNASRRFNLTSHSLL